MDKTISKNTNHVKLNENNIFNFNKVDAVAYLFLYILIPFFITVLSLLDYPSDSKAQIYCYLSILINALNCTYDAFNRWVNEKSLKNKKLFAIVIGSLVIVGYCLFIILSMLLIEHKQYRCDYWLLAYFIVVFIAIVDCVCCFTKEIAWIKCVDHTVKEVQ